LPAFSKVFKVRSHYLVSWGNTSLLTAKKATEFSHLSNLLSKFDTHLKDTLGFLQNYYFSELKFYNCNLFKDMNKLFVLTYIKNCLKFNFYKSYIFK